MNIVKNLSNELILKIYEYIPINIRLQLITKKYPVSLIRSYNYCLNIDECIKLYIRYIRNNLLIRIPKNNYDDFILKPNISELFPKILYKIRMYSEMPISISHNIEDKIIDTVSLKYLPRRFENWVPRNLKNDQRNYLSLAIEKTYAMFSTIEGDYKQLQYILKKTLLFYLIALIQKAKPEYEKSICLRDHIRIKHYSKRFLFKEMRKTWVQYNKRAKERIKEYIKQQKELKKKQKEQEKLKKNNREVKKVVIIRRKKDIPSCST